MEPICFVCEMKKYPPHKILDWEFMLERKNEFYPHNEYGGVVSVCEDCHDELIEYYLKLIYF